jgi:hypothetical protein
MNSLFSFGNHVRADQLYLTGGTTLVGGVLANLATPQLADNVVMRTTGPGSFTVWNSRTVRHAARLVWSTSPTPPGPLRPAGLVAALALNASTDVGPIADADLAVLWLVSGPFGSGISTLIGSATPIWPGQFPRNVYGAPAAETSFHTVELIVLHLGTVGTRMDVSLGGFWVGQSFRPARGLANKWTLPNIPGAETGEPEATPSRGGQAYFSTPPVRRRFTGQWAALSVAEAHGGPGVAVDWQAITVSTRGTPVIMVPRLRSGTDMSEPPDPQTMLRLGVYGFMQAGGGALVANPGQTYGCTTFTVDELL